MPLRESACQNHICVLYGDPVEWLEHPRGLEDPPCILCGEKTRRVWSSFGIVFTGALTARYNEPDRDNAHVEGHWAYPRRTDDGKTPSPVWIDTWQKQREFCKENNFYRPDETGTFAEISDDGRNLTGRGCKGQWV